jgi:2-(1,2-epoxy-1,2-dihydrophenyl)acetyl-CoA isomerase
MPEQVEQAAAVRTAAAVQLSVEDGVGLVRLTRPQRRNALDPRAAQQLLDALHEAEDGGVRAVVLAGSGGSFCAGRDITNVDPRTEDAGVVLEQLFNPVIDAVYRFPAPTFAAVHGAALGVGLGLALACDVVYAAEDARLGSPFGRLGAVLDSGAHAFMADRIGSNRTLELVYTGRLLSGTEAAAWGLVNAAHPAGEVLQVTLGVARTVAAGPTVAFGHSKHILQRLRALSPVLGEVLAWEAAAQRAASSTEDYREGFRAFQQKRPPTFHGR